jgi:prepilin-type N-terminal cleavage/methylation domain-containing protein
MQIVNSQIVNSPETKSRQGFTLIELSIVLVIIGLIVGGVLVGQDLIKAAQIRATVSQLDKYDAAVNTFRGKYNGLPGDLNSCRGFFAAADCPTVGTNAPGNGTLEDFSGTKVLLSGENTAFWHQLYLADMIGDGISDTSTINANAAVTAALIVNVIPGAKIGNGNAIIAYTGNNTIPQPGMTGTNLYRIANISSIAATGIPTLANALTPLEAFQIDVKKDDGVPISGVVQATDYTTGINSALDTYTAAAAGCVCNNGQGVCTGTGYNTPAGNSAENSRLCQLLIRASF